MPSPRTESPSGIRWNEVTWYSRLGAIFLFLGIVPALCFYIGTQYQAVRDAEYPPKVELSQSAESTVVSVESTGEPGAVYSPDKKKRAVFTSGDGLAIKDAAGSVLKEFSNIDLGGPLPSDDGVYGGIAFPVPVSPNSKSDATIPLWVGDTLWLADGGLYSVSSIIEVETNTYAVKVHRLFLANEFGTGNPPRSFNFNPSNRKLLFDTTPSGPYDTSEIKAYFDSGKFAHLYLYDLTTDIKSIIATSSKRFNALWIDASTVEFDNPNGEGRTQKQIQ